MAEQRVVMESLEELIQKKIPPRRLLADASCQTELTGDGGDLPFILLLERKLECWRLEQRIRLARLTYERQEAALRSELDELRDASEDIVPHGVAIIGLAQSTKR
jgi:hypothetical protein